MTHNLAALTVRRQIHPDRSAGVLAGGSAAPARRILRTSKFSPPLKARSRCELNHDRRCCSHGSRVGQGPQSNRKGPLGQLYVSGGGCVEGHTGNRESAEAELAFLERGGYGGTLPWRPVSMFLTRPPVPIVWMPSTLPLALNAGFFSLFPNASIRK